MDIRKLKSMSASRAEETFMGEVINLEKDFLSLKGVKQDALEQEHEKITEVCHMLSGAVMPSFFDVVMQLENIGPDFWAESSEDCDEVNFDFSEFLKAETASRLAYMLED